MKNIAFLKIRCKKFLPRKINTDILFILLIALIIRLPDLLKGMQSFYPGDDPTYALLAGKILLGDMRFPSQGPFVLFAITRYTMLFILASFYKAFGINDTAYFFYELFTLFTTFYASYLFFKELFNKRVAFYAGVFLAFLPIHIFLSSTIYPDTLLSGFLIGALSLMLKGLKRDKPVLTLLSGVTLGLSYYITINIVLLIPFLFFGFLWFASLNGRLRIKYLVRHLIILLAGLLLIYISVNVAEYKIAGTAFQNERVQLIQKQTDVHRAGGILQKIGGTPIARLYTTDPLLHTFGIAQQYLNKDVYYHSYPPLMLLSLVVGISIILSKRGTKNRSSKSIIILYVAWIFILYASYEFMSLYVIRKLLRYYLLLHVLTVLPLAYAISLTILDKYKMHLQVSILLLLAAYGIQTSWEVVNYPLIAILTSSVTLVTLLFIFWKKLISLPGVLYIAISMIIFNMILVGHFDHRMDYTHLNSDFNTLDQYFENHTYDKIYINSGAYLNIINYDTEYKLIKGYNNYWDALVITPSEHVDFLSDSNIDQLHGNSLVIVANSPFIRKNTPFGKHDFIVNNSQALNWQLISQNPYARYYRTPPDPAGIKTENIASELETTPSAIIWTPNKDFDKLSIRRLELKIRVSNGSIITIATLKGNNTIQTSEYYLKADNQITPLEVYLPRTNFDKVIITPSELNDYAYTVESSILHFK